MQSAVDRYAELNGLRIHYLDWGTSGKQPLVLLHGIARVAHTFDHLAPRFSDRYHVIAVDMRGHGDSAWHPEGAYTVEDYTSDIEALIEQMGLRNIVFWGNSTGGRVAQMMGGLHPDRVAGIVVEDVGPERPESISNQRAKRMAQEEDGWESAADLQVWAKRFYGRSPDAILSNFVAHGSRAAQRRTHRLETRSRDPEGVRAHGALEHRAQNQGADRVHPRRRQHDRSA